MAPSSNVLLNLLLCFNGYHVLTAHSLPPTKVPTNDPTTPSINPTTSPTSCLSAPFVTLDTTSFVGWDQRVYQSNAVATTFTIRNDSDNCYAINPCIRILGIDDADRSAIDKEEVYIERKLDSSLWSDVNFGIDVASKSFDDLNEFAFFETECNGNVERDTFLKGAFFTTQYFGCFYRKTPCNELIIRIGGRVSGDQDYLVISRVIYQDSSDSPTTAPTNTPSHNPTTSAPTTLHPTIFVNDNSDSNDGSVVIVPTIISFEPTTAERKGAVNTEDSSEESSIDSVTGIFENGMMMIILALSILLLCAIVIIFILWRRNVQRQKEMKVALSNMSKNFGDSQHQRTETSSAVLAVLEGSPVVDVIDNAESMYQEDIEQNETATGGQEAVTSGINDDDGLYHNENTKGCDDV